MRTFLSLTLVGAEKGSGGSHSVCSNNDNNEPARDSTLPFDVLRFVAFGALLVVDGERGVWRELKVCILRGWGGDAWCWVKREGVDGEMRITIVRRRRCWQM